MITRRMKEKILGGDNWDRGDVGRLYMLKHDVREMLRLYKCWQTL
jgi:hypothetical protein